MELKGKVAIVTGAARGLGRAFAHRLALLGADVVVADVDLNGAKKFNETLRAASVEKEIEDIGRRSLGIQLDLRHRDEVFAMMERVQQHFGRIDILVNNAGGALTPADRSAASVCPIEDIDLLMDLNFKSMVHCSQAAAPTMRDQGRGVIVNIAAQSAIATYKQGLLAGYGAAKLAVAHFSRCMAAELGPQGIRVNCMSPGVIMTGRVAAHAAARGVGTSEELQGIPLRRFGKPEDCVGVLQFLATDLSRYVTGQVISVCGGAVLTPH
jgi:NAD(P)-dependent dehydrogenase (short-subunit alcohol dehydrogenase family)